MSFTACLQNLGAVAFFRGIDFAGFGLLRPAAHDGLRLSCWNGFALRAHRRGRFGGGFTVAQVVVA